MTKNWKTKPKARPVLGSFPEPAILNPEDQRAIRYALFDNAPEIAPVWEQKRYRFELQLWEKQTTGIESSHKLVGYLSKLRVFGNLRYNKADRYVDWYAQAYENARVFDQTHNTNGIVLHCGIGRRQQNTSTQNGFALVPKLAASVFIPADTDYMPLIMLQFSDLVDEQPLDNESKKPAYDLYWHYKEVE